MNLGSMLKQAQKLQEKLAEVQAELGEKTVEASAGGGMVSAVANGRQEIVSVRIAPEVVQQGDMQMLEDLVTAAVNAALTSARVLLQEEMSKITGGLKIPGITI
jgi:hypothetical protein